MNENENAAMDLDHITSLARISLSEDEKNELSKSLPSILSHLKKLSSVDVEKIEPSAHSIPLRNIFRGDEIGQTFAVETALMNAPQQRNDQIIVPKVVE
ncbi:MAG: Asp-tRNA(Asn)/Glu-tRNA(Gln) amidotransferase subunit GatC [Puniceicoccales bacterium]|jgi:aspartyl-tRNA(Asn)/glutamyl-tRNA(Gln) amidotransferase subunit C|nr:Asp-tRNA(Asn)/Glu-tRNA(Gln) amidotransferase subunit GatC [Puniceicoccales bacterium]